MAKRRPSDDGMARKREDGRWEGRIVVGHKNNGNPIYRYVLAKTQAELTQKLHDKIEMYRDADLCEDCNMLLSEWLDKWIAEYIICSVRPNTLSSYTMMIKNQINPYLGKRPLSSLTTQEIQKFYNTIKKNGRVKYSKKYGAQLADSMVRKVHMMLHEALDMATKHNLIVNNPTNGTTLPKNNYAPKQILNDEQLDKFMEIIKSDEKWHDFFYTEITTGLRKGEICGLKWEDFNAQNGTLKICRSIGKDINGKMLIGDTKTGNGVREIILPQSTTDLLRIRKKNAVSEWIFPNLRKPEKPIHPQSVYVRLKAILQQAGLPSIGFHNLRHTFATHAIAGGVDAKKRGEILWTKLLEVSTMAKRRKQGEGILRLRKDGRWEGRVVIGYDDNSLPITKNVTAKSKTECAGKLEVLKSQYGKPSKKVDSDMSFGEWIDFWYQTYCKHTLRITTQIEYENRIYKHIIPEIGSIPLDQLTQSNLQQFYAREKANGRKIRTDIYGTGLSDIVIRAIHANCRSALEKAVQDGLIKTNPAVNCKLPPKKSREMKVLTKNEIIRFLNRAEEEGYYELFLLELGTGMRRGEIFALKWRDLNFKTGELQIKRQVNVIHGEIIIPEPKTKNSIRTALLPPSLLKTLSEYKKTVEPEWIFPSPIDDTKPRNPSAVRKRLQLILERAGCPKVRFHDLRHTFSTMALENGMDIKTLSAVLGHTSSETTIDIYSHITDTMRKQAAVKIDSQISGTEAEISQVEERERVDTTQPNFEPYKPKVRKSGTGCVTMINDHLYEGRYTPTNAYGKRESHNIYARTQEECEEKLAAMIEQVKADIKAEKKQLKAMEES